MQKLISINQISRWHEATMNNLRSYFNTRKHYHIFHRMYVLESDYLTWLGLILAYKPIFMHNGELYITKVEAMKKGFKYQEFERAFTNYIQVLSDNGRVQIAIPYNDFNKYLEHRNGEKTKTVLENYLQACKQTTATAC